MTTKNELAEWTRGQLEARRQRALADADKRRQQAYSRSPELYRLDSQLAAAAMEIASAAISAQGPQLIEEIREKIDRIQRQKGELLADQGLTAESLLPRYSCKKCSDTGFAEGRRCSCWQELYRQGAAKLLPPAAINGQCSFDSFRLDYYPSRDENGHDARKTMSRIAELCMEYAEKVGSGAGNLLFAGKTGLGKTHLSLAIARRAAERGCMVRYSSAQGVIDRYERTRFGRSPTPEDWEFVNGAPNSGLLVIDDLGSELVNSFSQSVIYNLINDRMMNNLETIISTNLDAAQITATYEQRISSRILCGYTALGFTGKDIRLMQRMNR